jgi:hypothetical protein
MIETALIVQNKKYKEKTVNRIPVTAPLTGQEFGVFFLRGHFSLKKGS